MEEEVIHTADGTGCRAGGGPEYMDQQYHGDIQCHTMGGGIDEWHGQRRQR